MGSLGGRVKNVMATVNIKSEVIGMIFVIFWALREKI